MDGNVSRLAIGFGSCSSSNPLVPDFLLGFGDAQGNFLAVKVSGGHLTCLHPPKLDIFTGEQAYGYTDLLSCMLLDA